MSQPTAESQIELTPKERAVVEIIRRDLVIADMVLLLVQHVGFQLIVTDLGVLLHEGLERKLHGELIIDFEPKKQPNVRRKSDAAPIRRRRNDAPPDDDSDGE